MVVGLENVHLFLSYSIEFNVITWPCEKLLAFELLATTNEPLELGMGSLVWRQAINISTPYVRNISYSFVSIRIWEQGAEENIWIEERWSDGRLEKTA
jgi:hypothetical protein